MALQLSSTSLEQAKEWHKSTLTTENRMVRDDKITVRGKAMKIEGFSPVLHQSGCILGCTCSVCNKTQFKYEKQGQTYWDCPDCEIITKV
ncbi:MAG: hypothetical protein QM500_15655 [Methylococcales bacterium]